MKITIEIPKEFEKDFNENRFGNYFSRVLADTLYHPMSDCSNLNLCGNYENETTRMFIKAFHNAEVSEYGLGKEQKP